MTKHAHCLQCKLSMHVPHFQCTQKATHKFGLWSIKILTFPLLIWKIKGFRRWNQISKREIYRIPKRIRVIIMAAATAIVIQLIRMAVILQCGRTVRCHGSSTQPLAYPFDMITSIILMASYSFHFLSDFSVSKKKKCLVLTHDLGVNELYIIYVQSKKVYYFYPLPREKECQQNARHIWFVWPKMTHSVCVAIENCRHFEQSKL